MPAGGEMKEEEEVLYLFSSICQNEPDEESTASTTPEKTEDGTFGWGRINDLLSADAGKHDYDWLVTLPASPPSKVSDRQSAEVASRKVSNIRSDSISQVSEFSAPQSESTISRGPTRSRPTVRSSLSSSNSSFTNISNSSGTSILDTNDALTATNNTSTPGNRISNVLTSRIVSVLPSRAVPSPSSTPTKSRQPLTSKIDKLKPLHYSQPSSPINRPWVSSADRNRNLNFTLARSYSQTSTPVHPAASSPRTLRSTSTSRASMANNHGSVSLPSSPVSYLRAMVQAIDIPDFPMDVPPNLRTKLHEKSLSGSGQRPGMTSTTLTNLNSKTTAPSSTKTRQSSLLVNIRSKLQECSPYSQLSSKNRKVKPAEEKSMPSETAIRRAPNPSSPTESNGFGRTISKKSIDIARKHMTSMGSIRGVSLFPASIRVKAVKCQSGRFSDPSAGKAALSTDDSETSDVTSETENSSPTTPGCFYGSDSMSESDASKTPQENNMTRLNNLDILSKHDAILQHGNLKNMNRLLSVEDKPEQGPTFDKQFKLLPEPYVPG